MADFDALKRAYRATDGWVHLNVATNDEWRRLRDMLGEAALADHMWDHHERHPADGEAYLPEFQLQIEDDPRFSSAEQRRKHASELSGVISEAFRFRTQQEWSDLLTARGVPHEVRKPAQPLTSSAKGGGS